MGRWVGVVALSFGLLALACGAGGEEVSEVHQLAFPGPTPVLYEGRPCRSDSFFVEAETPYGAPISAATHDAMQAVRIGLEAEANLRKSAWFCDGDPACPLGTIRVVAERVLPPRPAPAWRADAHLRFWRFIFRPLDAGPPLEVSDSAQCAVVRSLKNRVEVQRVTLGINAHFAVGRECEALAQGGAEATADEAMRTWHLDRLFGRDVTSAEVATGAPTRTPLADVAVVDTGLEPTIASALGATHWPGPPAEALHRHGSAMALLIRQLAPEAALQSYRALDTAGAGRTSEVARAVDAALFNRPAGRPLIVNLSLGWPASFSAPAELRGVTADQGTCSVLEDGVGRAVAHVLAGARALDDAGFPTFVASATGNRPGPHDACRLIQELGGPLGTVCSIDAAPRPSWFFPAAWNTVAAPSPVAGQPARHVATAVSGIDRKDRPQVLSIPRAEAPLVAPAEHVYVWHPAAAPHPVQPICSGGQPAPAIALPAAFTGSSVSAALVAGAAAFVQDARLASQQAPLSQDTLTRLLYLTGEPVCRTNTDGLSVRRLSMRRLQRALKTTSCQALLACAAEPSFPALTPATLASCGPALAACGLAEAPGSEAITCARIALGAELGWAAGYDAPVCATASLDDPSPAPSGADPVLCPSGVCPFASLPDRTLVGTLGPLPGDPFCPDCLLVRDTSAGTLTLHGEVEQGLKADTEVLAAWLVVEWKDAAGTLQSAFVPLEGVELKEWTPGATFTVSLPASKLDFVSWPSAKAELAVDLVSSANPLPASDVSPLRIKHL